MIRLGLFAAIALLVLPVLAACGRSTSATVAPSANTLYASRLTLHDVTPITGDAENWWDGPPTFDVRPLNSATREDAELGGVTVRFNHLGTSEILELDYRVWNSTSIASAIVSVNKLISGNGETGPKVGDQALYYNRKLMTGPTVYNNVAYVQTGQVEIDIVWSHVQSFATTKAVGAIASKVVSKLKNGIAHKAQPSPSANGDPKLLAPAGPQLTLLGAAVLPIEVAAEMVSPASSPVALTNEFHQNGVTEFVFGDYALNTDTRMEVLTAGIVYTRFPTGGVEFIKSYFANSLDSTGVAGGYDPAAGQYLFGFGSLNRAILVVCKSSIEGEEAARACEAPMALLTGDWHQTLGA